MAQRKNQTPSKGQEVIDKFIRESGEDFTGDLRNNVNWATGDEVKNLKKPNTQDYFDATKKRTTSPISEETIVIEENQKALNLIFRNQLNIRDMGNPLYGEEDKSFKHNLTININKANPNENKVCVIYGGDLLGTEWELKRLNNAKIITQSSLQELKSIAEDVMGQDNVKGLTTEQAVRKALFFALGEKVKVLKRDIKFALSHNVDVYLLNGAEEEKINKYFKVDVLQTIVKDINNPRLHLIQGVNTIVNVAKITKGNNRRYSTIGFLTNNSLSKSREGQQAVNAVKLNSGVNNADIVFVTNTNVAGKKGPKTYYVSGESTYITIAQKKFPVLSPKHYNCFSIRMPKSHELTVIEGHNMPPMYQLEKDVYDEYRRQEFIKAQIEENIKKELDKITAKTKSTDPVKTVQYFKNKYSKMNAEVVKPEVTTDMPNVEVVDDESETSTKENNQTTPANVLPNDDFNSGM